MLAELAGASDIQVEGDALPFQKELSALPLPFFDSALQTTTTIPFVFATATAAQLQAAGVVAWWFGTLASARPIRFVISIGDVPPGNAVLFVTRNSGTHAMDDTPPGGSLQLRGNPADGTGNLLVLTGDNEAQLLQVAQTRRQTAGLSGCCTVQLERVRRRTSRRKQPNMLHARASPGGVTARA